RGVEQLAEIREVEVQRGAFDPQRAGELAHRCLQPAGAKHLDGGAGQRGAASEVAWARHNLTKCQYKTPNIVSTNRSREDLPSDARIKVVDRGARQTVGMWHHPRAALVYAGSISWK